MTGQLALQFQPLARRSDPVTSKDAAEHSDTFRAKHEARIFSAICDAGGRGATAKEIAAVIGLDDVQVNRRLGKMGERHVIYRKLKPDAKGKRDFLARMGCAIWFKT